MLRICNAPDTRFEFPNRNFELVPADGAFLTIGRFSHRLKRIRDIVVADVHLPHILGTERYLVLEITLNRGQGDVLVDILRVRNRCRSDRVSIR